MGKIFIFCAIVAFSVFGNAGTVQAGTMGYTGKCRIGDNFVYFTWGAISNDGDGGGFWVTDSTGLFTIIKAPNSHHFPITARDSGGNNWTFSESAEGDWIILLESRTKEWEIRAKCDKSE